LSRRFPSGTSTRATLAIIDDSFVPSDLPAVSRKKVSANFDGGAISSDGGLLLLREADRRLGLPHMLVEDIEVLLKRTLANRAYGAAAQAIHAQQARLALLAGEAVS
jgi:hypothetical protein